MKKIITIKDINLLLYNLSDNFNLRYIRSAPKCNHCNISMVEWKLLTHCPNCGQELERIVNVKIHQKGRFICNGELYQYRNKNVKLQISNNIFPAIPNSKNYIKYRRNYLHNCCK